MTETVVLFPPVQGLDDRSVLATRIGPRPIGSFPRVIVAGAPLTESLGLESPSVQAVGHPGDSLEELLRAVHSAGDGSPLILVPGASMAPAVSGMPSLEVSPILLDGLVTSPSAFSAFVTEVFVPALAAERWQLRSPAERERWAGAVAGLLSRAHDEEFSTALDSVEPPMQQVLRAFRGLGTAEGVRLADALGIRAVCQRLWQRRGILWAWIAIQGARELPRRGRVTVAETSTRWRRLVGPALVTRFPSSGAERGTADLSPIRPEISLSGIPWSLPLRAPFPGPARIALGNVGNDPDSRPPIQPELDERGAVLLAPIQPQHRSKSSDSRR